MANLPTSIKNLNTLLGEQLTEGGGGGSSDFSTATVTFICPEGRNNYGVSVPVVDDLEDQAIVSGLVWIESGVTTELKVPLYKGKCTVETNGDITSIVCTGDVSCEDRQHIIITGDGSISAEADFNS